MNWPRSERHRLPQAVKRARGGFQQAKSLKWKLEKSWGRNCGSARQHIPQITPKMSSRQAGMPASPGDILLRDVLAAYPEMTHCNS